MSHSAVEDRRFPKPGDQQIKCKDCGQEFLFTVEEQAFYQEKKFTPPKRCRPCRQKKKQDQQNGVPRSQR